MVRRPDERIPVEPLSEPRWARIERSLEARLAEDAGSFDEDPVARRPWWRSSPVLVVAGAAAVALAVLAARPLFHTASASVSRIETGSAGSHLRVGGASIDVAPNTGLEVSGDDERGVLVVLDRGEVSCEVAPRGDRPAFMVQAGDVHVRVVGTRFTVKRELAEVSVDVTRGVVEVEAFGEKDRVPAGTHWPPDAPSPPSVMAPSEPSSPVPQTAATSVHPAAPHASSARTTVLTTPAAIDSAPSPGPATSPSAAPVETPSASSATSDARAGLSAQSRYEAAARLEARDPSAALTSYRQLAREGDDAWSANALYAAARLQADRGAKNEARAMAGEYLTRFPRGPNAADAKDLLNHSGSATP